MLGNEMQQFKELVKTEFGEHGRVVVYVEFSFILSCGGELLQIWKPGGAGWVTVREV